MSDDDKKLINRYKHPKPIEINLDIINKERVL